MDDEFCPCCGDRVYVRWGKCPECGAELCWGCEAELQEALEQARKDGPVL